MGSSGESVINGIDSSVGSLVWVRRPNGSWWPARIVGPDELSGDFLASTSFGTPVKLLGRDDASVDWYNLEKSKRVKAFRCGEYDECIAKAKAATAKPNKKKGKYVRREDAIIHALEIENKLLTKDTVNFSFQMSKSGGDNNCSVRESPATSHSGKENKVSLSQANSDSALGLSQSGISFEEPNHISASKLESVQGRRKTPNDSEDDGKQGIKWIRVLQDLGMSVVSKRSVQKEGLHEIIQDDNASVVDTNTQNGMPNGSLANVSKSSSSYTRKRSQVATTNEFLKRKSRSRPLAKVLESTEMMSIPVACDQLPTLSCSCHQLSDGKIPELEPNESKTILFVDRTRVSCDNDAFADVREIATVSSSNNQMKENEVLRKSEVLDTGSSERIIDVQLVGEEKLSSGDSATPVPCSSGRPDIGLVARVSTESRAEAESLRNERLNELGPICFASIQDIGRSLQNGSSKWQSKRKRNSKRTSRDRKHNSRKYMNVDDLSNANTAGTGDSDLLCYVSNLEENCNNSSGLATFNSTLQRKSKHAAELSAGPTQRSLPYRQSRFMVPTRYQTSDYVARSTSLCDVKVEIKAKYRRQRSLVSLTSKLNGKAIVGHLVTVKALDDGYSDRLFGRTECDPRGGKLGYTVQQNVEIEKVSAKHLSSPKDSPRRRKSGLLQKTSKLCSLTGDRQLKGKKRRVEKATGPVIACVSLKLVFSRINEAVNGVAPPKHHVLKPSET